MYQTNSDTLVLLGIKNPYIFKGVLAITLQFYLKNDNDAISINHDGSNNVNNFLSFIRINSKTADNFYSDFPELKELQVFGLYLQGMKVDEKELELYKALEDGGYRNITTPNADMINKREILFISREVNKNQSRFYKKLVDNTFSLNHWSFYQP